MKPNLVRRRVPCFTLKTSKPLALYPITRLTRCLMALASCIGIDPGFGSSPFGICVSTFIDGKARILFADEFPRPGHEEMALQIWDLIQYHNCNKVYIDNSSPSMIKSLKIHWGERSDYENIDREQYRFMKVEPDLFWQGT